MATPQALEALHKTNEALKDIRAKLKPYLDLLNSEHKNANDNDTTTRSTNGEDNNKKESAHRIAVARIAVALSIGTLRYMGNRLRGIDQGRHAKDPLRQELDHMRKLLVALQKKGGSSITEAEAATTAAEAKKKATTKQTTELSSCLTTEKTAAVDASKNESGKEKRKSEGSVAPKDSSENPSPTTVDGKRRKR
jgi:hypothetical protein